MRVVRCLKVLGYLRTITIEVVGHIIVFLAEYTPADEVAIATGYRYESTVKLVSEALCETCCGKHDEEGCENDFFHKIG